MSQRHSADPRSVLETAVAALKPASLVGPAPLSPRPDAGANRPRVACFAVQADADPGILPRVLALFAKRSLVPDRWTGQRALHDENELVIDLQVAGLDGEQTAYIARCLGQIPGVFAVLTAEKAAEI